jgi:hypothetical protein
MNPECPWCKDPNSEVEAGLCLMHEAELYGLTEEMMEDLLDRESEEAGGWL